MTEQQEHLKNLLQQFKELSNELTQIQNQAAVKRELLLKVQGAIEYLQQTGVLPAEETPVEETPVEETPVEETEE
jgi:hypothetical protein